MTATITITIRTSEKLAKKITSLAKTMDRSRNWVIEDALSRYVATEAEQIEGVKQAVKWFETHEGIPHERVMADMEKIIARHEKKK